eukprot:1175679-Prorocentrum_minimum.AAC.4
MIALEKQCCPARVQCSQTWLRPPNKRASRLQKSRAWRGRQTLLASSQLSTAPVLEAGNEPIDFQAWCQSSGIAAPKLEIFETVGSRGLRLKEDVQEGEVTARHPPTNTMLKKGFRGKYVEQSPCPAIAYSNV